MSRFRVVLLASAFSCLIAAGASAQDVDGTVGYGGGGIWFSDFNSGGAGSQLRLEPGWVATAHIENWMGRGRFGLRVNSAFTIRPLTTIDDERNIRTWIIGGDVLMRLAGPSASRSVAPFLGIGGGVVSYGLGEGSEVVLPGEQASYPGDSDRQLAVSGAFGIDILPRRLRVFGTPSGFRLEIIDHVALESPFTQLDGGDFDPVHNVRVSLSILGLVQLAR